MQKKNLLRKYWREIIIIILLLLAGLGYSLWSNAKLSANLAKDNLRISRDSTTTYRDAEGKLVSERESYRITAKDLKSQAEQLGFDKEYLEKTVGNFKNLVSHLKGELRASGTGTTSARDTIIITTVIEGDSTVIDSAAGKTFDWTNSYLTLSGTLNLDVDSIMLSYNYKKNLQEHIDEFNETQRVMMESYGVEVKGKLFNWTTHDRGEEISDKVKELRECEVIIEPLHFLTFEEVVAMSEGMTMGLMDLFNKHLCEENKPAEVAKTEEPAKETPAEAPEEKATPDA